MTYVNPGVLFPCTYFVLVEGAYMRGFTPFGGSGTLSVSVTGMVV